MPQQINADLDRLIKHLSTLRNEFDTAITSGKSFLDAKILHLRIKELNSLVEALQAKNAGAENEPGKAEAQTGESASYQSRPTPASPTNATSTSSQ